MAKEIAGQEVDEDIELSVDDLFKDPEESLTREEPSTTKSEDKADTDSKSEDDGMTERVKNRIKEVRRKAEQDTQEKIAKELGYNSYSEMLKAKESKLIKEHGFDEEDVEKLLTPLLEARLAADPRFKKLEEIEQREKESYITEQLKAINTISGNKFKSVEDLPDTTLKLWAKGVELEEAYLATAGKELLTKNAAKAQKGGLEHLAQASSNGGTKKRGLTEYEKEMYRSIMPDITEEELNSKMIDINK